MATKFIVISTEIMRDPRLNQSQKFILAEIEQLCTLESGCFASNGHFAELIGITKESVSRNINALMEMGYINIKMEGKSRNHARLITLTKIVRPPYQNSKTPLSKRQESKDNKQINKQINNNNPQPPKGDEGEFLIPASVNRDAIEEWFSYKGARYSKQGKQLSINFLAK